MGRKRLPIPLSSLEEHFQDQLEFLKKAMKDFDAGDEREYKRIALSLRVLLHDARSSQSLINQMNFGNLAFQSYAKPINPENLIASISLAKFTLPATGIYFEPILDRGPNPCRMLGFEEWWNEAVLKDNSGEAFTRKEIVLFVANQDGGAHVDPELDEKYHRLLLQNSIGMAVAGPDGQVPIKRIERVYIRHIGFEAYQSLSLCWNRIAGNRACECGSGRKARYCCSKQSARSQQCGH